MTSTTYDYAHGTDIVAEIGKMRAFGERVLVRAIMREDFNQGLLWRPAANSSDADCFEILAIGAGVVKWCDQHNEQVPVVGQHCDVRSTAADRVNQRDPTSRYWLVPVQHIAAVWDPVSVDAEGLSEALARAEERGASPVPVTGR